MTEYEQTKNGETLQEGYCEEDYQQTLSNNPDYPRITEQAYRDANFMDIIDKINSQLRPF